MSSKVNLLLLLLLLLSLLLMIILYYIIAGAIVGLTALGHQAVRNALYPNLHPYLALLQDQMQQSGNEMKRYEAYKCFGALLHAAGAAIRDRVK